MKYTCEIISDYKIIKVNVVGDLTVNEAASMGKTVRLKAIEMNYKILFDFTQTKNKISIGDAYFWFSDHYDTINSKLRYIKTAHLTNKIDKSDFDFFETSCFNKGISVKIFLETEKALEWLKR
jgi:hypothetical protein